MSTLEALLAMAVSAAVGGCALRSAALPFRCNGGRYRLCTVLALVLLHFTSSCQALPDQSANPSASDPQTSARVFVTTVVVGTAAAVAARPDCDSDYLLNARFEPYVSAGVLRVRSTAVEAGYVAKKHIPQCNANKLFWYTFCHVFLTQNLCPAHCVHQSHLSAATVPTVTSSYSMPA